MITCKPTTGEQQNSISSTASLAPSTTRPAAALGQAEHELRAQLQHVEQALSVRCKAKRITEVTYRLGVLWPQSALKPKPQECSDGEGSRQGRAFPRKMFLLVVRVASLAAPFGCEPGSLARSSASCSTGVLVALTRTCTWCCWMWPGTSFQEETVHQKPLNPSAMQALKGECW